MSVTRARWQRLLFPGLSMFSFKSFNESEEMYSKIFRVLSSDAAFEEAMTGTGVGLPVRTPENTEPATDEFSPGFKQRWNHDDYTLGIGFSHQSRRDMKVSLMQERASDLGYSFRQMIEVLTHDILNRGFDATYIGPDGKALFASDHPNIRQGTQSNLLTPVGPLTVTNYRQGLTQFRRFFDHTGVRRIGITPVNLIVPPEREYDALEIVKSSDRPDTANRATNVSQNKTGVVVDNFIISTVNWFLSCDKARTKVIVYLRERFHTWETEDEKKRLLWMFAACAFSYAWVDWQGWLGANPS